MPEKIKFSFCSEVSASCSQTTVVKIKSMQPHEDGPVYAFPAHLQSAEHHEDVMKTPIARMVKKALAIRGRVRNCFITLPNEVVKKYLDDDGNAVFNDEILEEIWDKAPALLPTHSSSVVPIPITNVTENPPKKKTLSSLLKDAVIEKFGTRSINAESWLDLFENECIRLEVPQDRFWEAIRFFLEGSAIDWYQSTQIVFKNVFWEGWKSSFLDAFV